MVEVKSGMVITFETRPTTITPEAMPATAMPIGKPMARTDPKAKIKMTMANPSPSTSDSGGSNSPNTWPPNSTRNPAFSAAGTRSLTFLPMACISAKSVIVDANWTSA